MASEFELLDILYRAEHSPHGLIIDSSNPKQLRERLYAPMRKENLDFHITIIAGAVWIVKKELKDESQS